jgi:hypothetical protein
MSREGFTGAGLGLRGGRRDRSKGHSGLRSHGRDSHKTYYGMFSGYHGKSSETVRGARLSDEKQINADISKLC